MIVIRIDGPQGPRWVGSPVGMGTTPNPNLAACFNDEADARRTPGTLAYFAMGAKVGPLDIKAEHVAWVARGRP